MVKDLTEAQRKRIAETLRRIRAGLRRAQLGPFVEPAHLFEPEAQNDTED